MLEAKLVVVGGDAKKTEVSLDLPVVIGRGKEAGLTVPHALVSRKHTEIYEQDGRLFVRDLGSLNGTYLNNTRIECEQPLDPNQLLTLGNITFRAVYELGAAAISPAVDETLADLVSQSETAAIPVVKEVVFNEDAKVYLPSTSVGELPHAVEPIPLASPHQLGNGSLSELPIAASIPVTEVPKPVEIVSSQPTDPALFEDPCGTQAPSDTSASFVGRETLTDSSVFQFSSDDQKEPSQPSAEFLGSQNSDAESPREDQPGREGDATLDNFLKNFPK
ncbi:FHA domain-containing protein [Mariniblastus sp.]|jgi:predicted component of type VI protein secretion system|nr:FHA domain-containing protein [Mariniblastus sp.]